MNMTFPKKIKHLFLFGLILNCPRGSGALPIPNYQFSLKTLLKFLPEKKIKVEKWKDKIIHQSKDSTIYRWPIITKEYSVEVLLEVMQGIITTTYMHFPSYFLNNLLLQDLKKLFGKKYSYSVHRNNAFYRWSLQSGITITYSASCSNTCFPIYLLFKKKIESKENSRSALKSKINFLWP